MTVRVRRERNPQVRSATAAGRQAPAPFQPWTGGVGGVGNARGVPPPPSITSAPGPQASGRGRGPPGRGTLRRAAARCRRRRRRTGRPDTPLCPPRGATSGTPAPPQEHTGVKSPTPSHTHTHASKKTLHGGLHGGMLAAVGLAARASLPKNCNSSTAAATRGSSSQPHARVPLPAPSARACASSLGRGAAARRPCPPAGGAACDLKGGC